MANENIRAKRMIFHQAFQDVDTDATVVATDPITGAEVRKPKVFFYIAGFLRNRTISAEEAQKISERVATMLE